MELHIQLRQWGSLADGVEKHIHYHSTLPCMKLNTLLQGCFTVATSTQLTMAALCIEVQHWLCYYNNILILSLYHRSDTFAKAARLPMSC